MTEDEYTDATNLTKLRMAKYALCQVTSVGAVAKHRAMLLALITNIDLVTGDLEKLPLCIKSPNTQPKAEPHIPQPRPLRSGQFG